MNLNNIKIAVIGLGYVGLPLAVELGKKYSVTGFDINSNRIKELNNGNDSTLELEEDDIFQAKNLKFTSNKSDISDANFYIVTVPTPIDELNSPDLSIIIKATEMLGEFIKNGDVVVYESTVYPGVTEEVCVPIIENKSGLIFNKDFYVGYSPERIVPGDKINTLTKITKITSGSSEEASHFIDSLYKSIIKAGTYRCESIKVAEAAKVIENVQRDVNIALINELYQIFETLNINTNDVINAASTKWNFMKLKPGLVGGHCIGVDPYYLLHKSLQAGYTPDLIRQAREINNSMADFIFNMFMKNLLNRKINPLKTKIYLLGFSFKENCPDIRNTQAIFLYNKLKESGLEVYVYDNLVNKLEVQENMVSR